MCSFKGHSTISSCLACVGTRATHAGTAVGTCAWRTEAYLDAACHESPECPPDGIWTYPPFWHLRLHWHHLRLVESNCICKDTSRSTTHPGTMLQQYIAVIILLVSTHLNVKVLIFNWQCWPTWDYARNWFTVWQFNLIAVFTRYLYTTYINPFIVIILIP